jgi:hypothetical protein
MGTRRRLNGDVLRRLGCFDGPDGRPDGRAASDVVSLVDGDWIQFTLTSMA